MPGAAESIYASATAFGAPMRAPSRRLTRCPWSIRPTGAS